jgi:glycosyltransferase involved in cell wall biosynthesis
MSLRIAHITASPSFGGVERLILEVGRSLQRTKDVEQIFASFPENGRAEPFLHEIKKSGFTPYGFKNDMPHLFAATRELIRLLKKHQIQILCAHGHKARMLGWFATKWLRIPIIGISHGWTGETKAVQLYERIDKWMHRRMDHIVCVSQGQADKVIRFGTPASRVSVIYNAVRMDRFNVPSDISFRQHLESMFSTKPELIIGAAGRLSPEKGFDVLINACANNFFSAAQRERTRVAAKTQADTEIIDENIGFVIFGEGFLREPLQKQIDELGLSQSVVMPGFTDELDKYMHHFDLFVQSSHTEGLPSVLLEAMSARTAVVATRVGGTGELVVEGSTGLMVQPNDSHALAEAMRKVICDDELRRTMGENGRQRVEQSFTIEPQAEAYWKLFCRLLGLDGKTTIP